ncbi:hypothetical protein P152DRAFT_461760 [Eremomyces bilateralis CBS 781.70]|uniref:Endonuclease n=1 Tax=Eremomyces bilateralis CBS 781.70 TaxID=1392243 RepID=A0A6G1FTQ3_9PEZI|nr:uncharacterized protein P152DRAFT_461760 [Eremomyces bilateralis CBS 781.70]KAF1809120.1 hypothetical protein P152DRAFT_461760 [Eremomyces bilateralis CBS 781.70]
MAKITVAALVIGAGAGAAVTAAFTRRKEEPTSLSLTTTTITTPSTTSAPNPVPISAQGVLAAPVDPSGIFNYGFPGPTADLRPSLALVSSFDRRTRNPHWVAEHITPASLAGRDGNRKHSSFAEDDGIPEKFRAKLSDYFRSGYDRGHQVPAADAKWSQQAMNETFLLSNMCPQVGDGFNRDYWAHFEDFCRRLTHKYPSVRIVTGPLYLPRKEPDGKWRVSYEVVGSPPNVAVPTHFFKVIFAEDGKVGGNVAVGAFVLPNARIANDRSLKEFEVPLEMVEKASGLEFAEKLPLNRRKRLCGDMQCEIMVREYADRQKAFVKK